MIQLSKLAFEDQSISKTGQNSEYVANEKESLIKYLNTLQE
jgi:hypothetical protein